MKFPALRAGRAKKLFGKSLKVGSKTLVFESEIKMGGQAMLIPLRNPAGKRVAYFRSLSASSATAGSIERISWMIGQRLHLLSSTFRAAPQFWINSETHGRPEGIDFDFAGTIIGVANGQSWKSIKDAVVSADGQLPTLSLRIELAKSLIQQLACLEAVGSSGFIHGDLSDGNIMIDLDKGKVALIDFDCFVFESPTLSKSALSFGEGGSVGTHGYYPESVEEPIPLDAIPLGDRFGRDMLLLELLGFGRKDSIEASPLFWEDTDGLFETIKTSATLLKLYHLLEQGVFDAPNSKRPSSLELATRLNLTVENHTDKLLDSPPWDYDAFIPPASEPSQQDSVSTDPASKSLLLEIFNPDFTLKKVLSNALDMVDQAVVGLGKGVIGAGKIGAAFFLSLLIMFAWLFLILWMLTNVNVPLNLILCGGFGWGSYTIFRKYVPREESSGC